MMRTVPFLVLFLFAAVAHDARAQVPPSFTSHHVIQFAPGTESVRKLLSGDPSVRDLVAGTFEIAREDLNDDGSKEMILLAQDSMSCGSGGCSLVVLELRAGKIATILSRGVLGTLAVTNEKFGGYKALAAVDEQGTIILGDKAGTPLFRKQLVYPMEVAPASPTATAAQAAQPRQPPPRPSAAGAVCASPLCTENLEFAATVSDFRAILENTNSKTLTVRMSFRNKLSRPLVLGYVTRSAVATDERGNRYELSGQRAVQAIGEIVGTSADAKFQLQPDESSDARFELTWHTSGREIFGVTFQFDLAIREVIPMPGNQIRLGREYALHFDRLGGTTPSPTVARSPATPPASALPSSQPQADACGGRSRCFSAGPFAAEIIALTPSSLPYSTPVDVLQARVRFRNLTNQPIILGYTAGSAVITDNFGNRYSSTTSSYGDGAKGIGIVRDNQADAQFVLNPATSGDATFSLSRGRARTDRVGETASFDMTIAQLEVLPGQQIRTVRDFSVGFTNLSLASANPTASAPVTGGGALADADACGGKPRCYSAGPFVAEILGLTPSSLPYSTPVDVLQARVRFRNLTNQPIILGYTAGSAVITDNFGNRYSSTTPSYGDGAKGIGIVRDNQADPQFVLRPGASGDVTFSLSRGRARTDRAGATFTLDLTIAQLEVLDSRQIRTVREYAVGVPNLTASGAGLLNKLLQGLPKKNEHR